MTAPGAVGDAPRRDEPGAPEGPGARGGWASAARADLLGAGPAWVVSRVLVLGALALAHFLVNNLHVTDPSVIAQEHQGLFAWDAGFYRGIAQHLSLIHI